MSGIAGIIHFDGAPVAPSLVESMTAAMLYRGPDGIHHWANGSVALGQCMSHTTPESLTETQPLASADESLVLVMDGRVDNWIELRRELLACGAVLRDRSDAEIVLAAYTTWGQDCLAHIDGDFALVIWDARQRRAFCARDRLGSKPFHYHWDGKTLAFASELHPILALLWVPEVINEGMLAEYLAAEWHSRDETLWCRVMRLVAAQRLVASADGLQLVQYWQPDLLATLPLTRDEEYFDCYRELLFDSVRRMSRSHRPVAFEVSGGLDSSAVFCVAEHLRRAQRLPAPGIAGYTLAFSAAGDANELPYAHAVGEHLGLPIHEVPPSIWPLSWFADNARTWRDFPGFPNAAMSMGLLQQALAQGSRVVLSGEGGDQWLQGSRQYYAEALAQRDWPRLRDAFSTDTAVFGKVQALRWLVRYGVLPLLQAPVEDGLRRLSRALLHTGPQPRYWLTPAMHARLASRRQASARPRPRVRRAGQRELLETLADPFSELVQGNGERLSARAGVELRSPFFDHRIVQFAFSTPEHLRLRGERTKYLHVRALEGILPGIILERTSKAEFSVVFDEHLDRMREELTRTIPAQQPDWITTDGMASLYQSWRDHPQSGWESWALWAIHGCAKLSE